MTYDFDFLWQLMDEKAREKTKIWWENYLKHVIDFRGVKMADIRSSLHEWLRTEQISEKLSSDAQIDIALQLIREKYAEDKLAGILYFQEVLIPGGMVDWQAVLPKFAGLFQDGHIYDWNICDWFCVRVLGPMAIKEGESCSRAIAGWRSAENLWQRRASGIAFVNLAKNGDENFDGFIEMLLTVCQVTVMHPERFSQTGTGWVLRELWQAAPVEVLQLIETHIRFFSAEGLRYATEKMSAAEKKRLKLQRQMALKDG